MKKLIFIIAILLSFASPARALETPASTLTSGLVGYWTVDGKNIFNGTALDSSGSGNTGNFVNIATTSLYTAGQTGQGIRFDGSNDCLRTPLQLPQTGSFSVSAWIRYDGTQTGTNYLWSQDLTGSNTDITLGYNATLGGFFYENEIDSTDAITSFAGNNFLQIGKWYHVVVVEKFTGDVDGNDFYINGVKFASASGVAGNPGTGNFLIGGREPCTANGWGGVIDEVRAYNRQLSQLEVTQLYMLGQYLTADSVKNYGSLGTNLQAYWTMDGADMLGGRLLDVSGNGNTGTLLNVASTTFYTAGKIGQGFNFDGVDDYVTTNDFTVLEGATTATWSAWIRPSALNNLNTVMAKFSTNGANDSWRIGIPASGLGVGTDDLALYFTGAIVGYTNQNYLATSTWTHAVWVYDGTQGTNATKLKLFINGVQRTLTFVGTVPASLASTNSNVTIGALALSSPAQFFNGVIDDARIYTRNLTDQEVTQLYMMNRHDITTPKSYGSIGSGLAGYWNFDGSSILNGVIRDLSGNGNTGNLISIASSTFYTAGKIGQAVNFDGVNDYILISDSSLLRPTTVTISAWVKAKPSAKGYIVIKDKGTGTSYHLGIAQNTAANTFGFCSFVSGSYTCASTSNTAYQNVWTHVVGVYDGTNRYIYINGVLADTKAGGAIDYTGPLSLYIGGYTGGANTINALVDDARIYNRALSAQEVLQLYMFGQLVAI